MEEKKRMIEEERKKRRMFQDLGRKMLGVYFMFYLEYFNSLEMFLIPVVLFPFRGSPRKGETRAQGANGA